MAKGNESTSISERHATGHAHQHVTLKKSKGKYPTRKKLFAVFVLSLSPCTIIVSFESRNTSSMKRAGILITSKYKQYVNHQNTKFFLEVSTVRQPSK